MVDGRRQDRPSSNALDDDANPISRHDVILASATMSAHGLVCERTSARSGPACDQVSMC